MILPLGLIWKLQMPLAQKASVGGLFCLATIVIIVASIRVTELGSKDGGFDGVRPTWLAFWGQLESTICELPFLLLSSLGPVARCLLGVLISFVFTCSSGNRMLSWPLPHLQSVHQEKEFGV